MVHEEQRVIANMRRLRGQNWSGSLTDRNHLAGSRDKITGGG